MNEPLVRWKRDCGPEWSVALLGFLLWFWPAAADGQALSIKAALPGYIETGIPPFVVLGPEALGLSAAPVDLHQMPDGRILAFGHGELALGDGVRWEVFRQADDDPRVSTASVATDQDGRIYAGMAGGFGRVEFSQDGRWRCARVEKLPADLRDETDALTGVSMVGDNWYWSWGSGPIIAWKPGRVPRTVGRLNALERVFTMGSSVFMSDQSNGMLFQLKNGDFSPVAWERSRWNIDRVLTCTVPVDDGATLVGAISLGLLRYDGTDFQPLVSHGPLAGGHRINDLCDAGNGLLAAAVENVGVVFIDRKGRIIQSLDRSVDNRLARVKRLLRTPGGILWALLNEGIARISFPARFSSLEAMVTTGMGFSQPYRHEGRLWLLADGQAQRGVYDDEHRLVRFEIDTPGPYLVSMIDLDGIWVAATEDGIFRHESGGGWAKLAQGPHSSYMRPEPVQPGCWLYTAENETGWLRHIGDEYVFERFAQSGMGHVYGAVADAHGVFWAELGSARVARIEPTLPRPTVEVLGPAEGLHDAWVQLFIFEGEVRVNMRDQILRYDRNLRRFSTDTELLRRIPALAGALGRPAADALGRLWITRPDKVLMVDLQSPQAIELAAAIPEGLQPFYFTPQSDGVVWMNEPGRLARFDPALPAPEPPFLRAQITRVELPATGRVLFPADERIADLPVTNSTMVIHYLAPNQPFGQSVSFEVQLSGADGSWVSTGGIGSITFNHLDPGSYRLHVRPRLGRQIGDEARLDFSILAPWYRTRLAYLLIGIGGLGALVSALWLSAVLARREKLRLERLVAIRTSELERQIHETTEKTAALRASEEQLRQAQRMEAVGQLAGGVAHDYNNILTSTLMQLGLLLGDPNLTEEVRHSLGQLVSDAERAAGLTRQLLMFSRRQVIQVKQIDLNEVLANLLKMLRRLLGETINLEFQGSPQPLWIKADAGMIEQIVTNLCVNARDAMAPNGGQLTIDARLVPVGAGAAQANAEARPGTFVCLSVIDTGCGMDAATLKHIFEPFFTTKEVGKGTGLGLATVYGITKQHGGWVEVVSEVGRGSVFRVYLPAAAKGGPRDSGPAEVETHQGTETILLVEDDQAVRDMVVQGLRRQGYRVFLAANGQEAEEIWNRSAGEIDLLFTDIRMPGGMSGLELYERFKHSKPSLQVVISSGYSEEIVKLGMTVNPFLVFLPKPYDVKTLADTVRRCLDRA
jgi:signal transduction histidine kinase/CheY-like chemotaxis protein